MIKPSLPKGTRDFSPLEVSRRTLLINRIQKHFSHYGFQPIETPSFENLSTLTGKYGEEGDRLIFKILNSGDFLKKITPEDLEQKSASVAPKLSDKALRYDLTIPFARYVVQHQSELTFPFKRYQIQPVWRADRPQKGRFREFYQCDADVIGSRSLWQEVELIHLYDAVFTELKLPVTLHLNHRKILSGLAEATGIQDQLNDFTQSLDKLDKIGKEGVIEEMNKRGLAKEAIDQLDFLFSENPWDKQKEKLTELLADSEIGKEGLAELEFIRENCQSLSSAELNINLCLARGLDYYTGAIFEVTAKGVEMGSIGGGGRYDDLTSIFGLKNMPGIGISFGLDRIYLVMEALGLFDTLEATKTRVLFIHFSEEEAKASFQIVQNLRKNGIIAELYPEAAKLKKQFNYANKAGFSHVAMVGEEEIEHHTVSIKNLSTGEQETLSIERLSEKIKN